MVLFSRFGASWRHAFIAAPALATLLAPVPALADPRDDVVAGMMRCAVISDDRQWLECYYGAAQPMRSRLGLPPAPQSQQQLLQQHYSGAPVYPVMPQAAAPLAPLGQPAYQLQYQPQYQPQQQMASAPPVPSGPPPMPGKRGMFSDFFGGSDIVRNMPLQSYSFNSSGAFTVTLSDGQVWEQTADDAGRHPAKWFDPANTMRVTIGQGAMNTFNMIVNGVEATQYKVHRVR